MRSRLMLQTPISLRASVLAAGDPGCSRPPGTDDVGFESIGDFGGGFGVADCSALICRLLLEGDR